MFISQRFHSCHESGGDGTEGKTAQKPFKVRKLFNYEQLSLHKGEYLYIL